MTRVIHGVVRGKTIEFTQDLGLAEGQDVEVFLRSLPGNTDRQSGAGLLSTEGALADDPYWDDIMSEVYQERKQDTRPEAME